MDKFLSKVETALESNDVPLYLTALSPELRDRERRSISSYFENFGFETISIFTSNKNTLEKNQASVFFQVLYQNSYSALLEIWKLDLKRAEGMWRINKKQITGDVSSLYKLKIPSGLADRVESIEINHLDINIRFGEAYVFYDNLPDLETGLLIMGKGHLRFSPSIEREQHQLNLIFKRTVLEDELNYVYLRFSNSFFRNNIKIEKAPQGSPPPPIPEPIKRVAYSIFSRHYPRSFTIENSLTDDLLTFIPQGDEAVIEFQGKRHGKFTYVFSPYAEEEINLFHWKNDRLLSLYSPAIENVGKKLFVSIESKVDIKNYTIDIDFNPEKKFISGRAIIDVESKSASIGRLKLKFNPAFEILRVNDWDKNSLFYTQDKLRNNLYIYFLRPMGRNESQPIEIFYRGVLEPPEAMTDVVTSGQMNDELIVMNPPNFESFLYSHSSLWYPSPEHDDFFTSRMKIIVPPRYSVVASGNLVEKTRFTGLDDVMDIDEVGSSVYEYQSQNPMKYLTFMVGKFRKIREDLNGTPIHYYRTLDARVPTYDLVSESRDILDFYTGIYGPIPFDRLTIAHRMWKNMGGHSPPSLVILNEFPLLPSYLRMVNRGSPVNLFNYKEYFLAHEIAHQWWGQGVSWETYHDQWISEGMAQLSSILYLKHKLGDGAFNKILRKFSKGVKKYSVWGQILMGSRISFVEFEAYQTIVYNKSSLALNMLREIVGDVLFFQGIKRFYRLKKFSSARSQDFFRILNEVTERDLTSFFQKWFDSYLLPDVEVKQSVRRSGSGYELRIDISQKGDTFVFPLLITWIENGKRVAKKVVIDRKIQEILFTLDSKPTKIKFNENGLVPAHFH
ncbi:M1 family metallopeptidase [Acidobacteriota bacterium]